MKKIHIECEGPEPVQTLYYGISRIDCGWMLTTAGNPVTRNDYEDTIGWYDENSDEYRAAESDLSHIESLIEADRGEECDERDIDYINEWLEIWGI